MPLSPQLSHKIVIFIKEFKTYLNSKKPNTKLSHTTHILMRGHAFLENLILDDSQWTDEKFYDYVQRHIPNLIRRIEQSKFPYRHAFLTTLSTEESKQPEEHKSIDLEYVFKIIRKIYLTNETQDPLLIFKLFLSQYQQAKKTVEEEKSFATLVETCINKIDRITTGKDESGTIYSIIDEFSKECLAKNIKKETLLNIYLSAFISYHPHYQSSLNSEILKQLNLAEDWHENLGFKDSELLTHLFDDEVTEYYTPPEYGSEETHICEYLKENYIQLTSKEKKKALAWLLNMMDHYDDDCQKEAILALGNNFQFFEKSDQAKILIVIKEKIPHAGYFIKHDLYTALASMFDFVSDEEKNKIIELTLNEINHPNHFRIGTAFKALENIFDKAEVEHRRTIANFLLLKAKNITDGGHYFETLSNLSKSINTDVLAELINAIPKYFIYFISNRDTSSYEFSRFHRGLSQLFNNIPADAQQQVIQHVHNAWSAVPVTERSKYLEPFSSLYKNFPKQAQIQWVKSDSAKPKNSWLQSNYRFVVLNMFAEMSSEAQLELINRLRSMLKEPEMLLMASSLLTALARQLKKDLQINIATQLMACDSLRVKTQGCLIAFNLYPELEPAVLSMVIDILLKRLHTFTGSRQMESFVVEEREENELVCETLASKFEKLPSDFQNKIVSVLSFLMTTEDDASHIVYNLLDLIFDKIAKEKLLEITNILLFKLRTDNENFLTSYKILKRHFSILTPSAQHHMMKNLSVRLDDQVILAGFAVTDFAESANIFCRMAFATIVSATINKTPSIASTLSGFSLLQKFKYDHAKEKELGNYLSKNVASIVMQY